jgi:hypothetical protein
MDMPTEAARLVDLGGTLARLHFWIREEWDALPEHGYPGQASYSDYLGRSVGAVPVPKRKN